MPVVDQLEYSCTDLDSSDWLDLDTRSFSRSIIMIKFGLMSLMEMIGLVWPGHAFSENFHFPDDKETNLFQV